MVLHLANEQNTGQVLFVGSTSEVGENLLRKLLGVNRKVSDEIDKNLLSEQKLAGKRNRRASGCTFVKVTVETTVIRRKRLSLIAAPHSGRY